MPVAALCCWSLSIACVHGVFVDVCAVLAWCQQNGQLTGRPVDSVQLLAAAAVLPKKKGT